MLPVVYPEIDDREQELLNASYQSLSRTLRTWLVAFGIGAPVLFASQETLSNAIKESQDSKAVLIAYFVGVSLQVCMVLAYKVAMFYMTQEYGNEEAQENRAYQFWVSFSQCIVLEIAADLFSIICFAWATWRALDAFYLSK